jgi:lysozyme
MATLNSTYVLKVNHFLISPIQQNQFDALVDFAYNCGTENLRTSHLLQFVNNGDMDAASEQFGKWIHCNGEVNNGLVRRRETERQLFVGDI